MSYTAYKSWIGFGDGDERVFDLPVSGYEFFSYYEDGVEKFPPDYELIQGVSDNGLDLLILRTAPAVGVRLEIDYVNADEYMQIFGRLLIDLALRPARIDVEVL